MKSWTYVHQDTSTVKAFRAEDGILYITTRKGTMDRPKLFAPQIYIDGVEQKSIQTQFGPDEAVFRIFVSVENLMFIGTHIASQDNTGAYEWVKFKGHTIEK